MIQKIQTIGSFDLWLLFLYFLIYIEKKKSDKNHLDKLVHGKNDINHNNG